MVWPTVHQGEGGEQGDPFMPLSASTQLWWNSTAPLRWLLNQIGHQCGSGLTFGHRTATNLRDLTNSMANEMPNLTDEPWFPNSIAFPKIAKSLNLPSNSCGRWAWVELLRHKEALCPSTWHAFRTPSLHELYLVPKSTHRSGPAELTPVEALPHLLSATASGARLG